MLTPQTQQLSEPLLESVIHHLQLQGVLAAWLYGSFVKNTANEQSDIDLALLLPDNIDPWQQLPSLDHALSNLTGFTVNCISIIHAPTPLAYEAVQGKRLYGHSDAMLIEQRIWSKWEDCHYWNKQA